MSNFQVLYFLRSDLCLIDILPHLASVLARIVLSFTVNALRQVSIAKIVTVRRVIINRDSKNLESEHESRYSKEILWPLSLRLSKMAKQIARDVIDANQIDSRSTVSAMPVV